MTTSHGHGGGGGSSSGYGHRSTYSLKSRQSSFTSSKEDLAEKRAAATLARKNSGIPVYSPIKSECKHSKNLTFIFISSYTFGKNLINTTECPVFFVTNFPQLTEFFGGQIP